MGYRFTVQKVPSILTVGFEWGVSFEVDYVGTLHLGLYEDEQTASEFASNMNLMLELSRRSLRYTVACEALNKEKNR